MIASATRRSAPGIPAITAVLVGVAGIAGSLVLPAERDGLGVQLPEAVAGR